MIKAQRPCREYQYPTGASPNLLMAMPQAGVPSPRGKVKQTSRSAVESPVTRAFGPACGTPVLTGSSKRPGAIIVKAEEMDNAAQHNGPDVANFLSDPQRSHLGRRWGDNTRQTALS